MSDNIAGIDYSMNCPCICVGPKTDTPSYEDCQFHLYTERKLSPKALMKNIEFTYPRTYHPSNPVERFLNIAEWADEILYRYEVTKINMEGYSMGSKGQVFQIAENTMMLKYMINKRKIPLIITPPTTLKKMYFGKGNAKKAQMYTAFCTSQGVDLKTLLDNKTKGFDSPMSDIVDAFALYSVLARGLV